MAEGFLRQLGGERYAAHSAGRVPKPVHPMTIEVMEETGIDLSEHRSKDIQEFLGREKVDYAVFVCAKAEAECPSIYPFALHKLSWPFEDPAAYAGTGDEKRAKFREVRDQIRARIEEWLAEQTD
jgi:arsenate reductase